MVKTQCGVVVVATASLISSQAIAQDSDELGERIEAIERDSQIGSTARTIEADGSGSPAGGTAQPARLAHALLREGAHLTEAPGKLVFDDAVEFWVFRTDLPPTDDRLAPRQFVMLPCTKLAEMVRLVEASELDVVFKLTGRVYAFRDSNYVLPLTAPILERYEQPDTTTLPDADAAETRGNTTRDVSQQSAEDLINQLRQEVPVSRPLSDAGRTTETDAPADGSPTAIRSEGTLIASRRGRVAPTPGGGWQFVFTADQSGLGDPPMMLLPCLLLESLEDGYARNSGSQDIEMTGEVVTWKGRNFLMPTFYRRVTPERNLK